MISVTIASQKDPSRTLRLKTPVMNAAGCFDAHDFSHFIDLNALGAYVTKSITKEPWGGSEPPRINEVTNGMVHSIGLHNKGIELFTKTSLAFVKQFDLPVVVSIAGKEISEYVDMAKILDQTAGVHAIEINISCTDTSARNEEFGKNAARTHEVVSRIREATSLPLVTKLSPNVSDIVEIAKAAQEGGTDALCLINAVHAMSIDIKTRKPVLGNTTGCLSGPAIKPIALYSVWQVSHQVDLPIIGVGGISNAHDALEFFIAGASAIQVGTMNFINPKVMIEIIEGLEDYFRKNNIRELGKIRLTEEIAVNK